jgi:hypothetical protein
MKVWEKLVSEFNTLAVKCLNDKHAALGKVE